MIKLVHITTVPDSLIFIEGQIQFMRKHGFDLSVITSPGEKLDAFEKRTGVPTYAIEMPRAITPLEDLKAIVNITNTLFKISPNIVHAHTPKGGLLGMISATSAMVPIRIYQMRGLLTFTATGKKKEMFRRAEQLSCTLANQVICQSHSLQKEAIHEKILTKNKSTVLLSGSNGVDSLGKFCPENDFNDIRKKLNLKKTDVVAGFIGRLVKDKGIEELVKAWRIVRQHSDAKLIVVGPIEARDAVDPKIIEEVNMSTDIYHVGFTRDTPSHYKAFDFLILPTYREGFPNVPLEAAAMGIPTIATKIPGCTDAVIHNRTGLLIPARDTQALADSILRYIRNPDELKRHGKAARERVLESFQPEDIWEENLKLYHNLVQVHASRH